MTRQLLRGLTLAICAALAMAPRAARAAADTVIVSSSWLADRLADPSLVILHVAGSRGDYDSGHIPGARFIEYDAFVTEGDHGGSGLNTELPSVAALVKALESLGVSDGSRIVLYGARAPITARLFVTLDHLGLGARTSVLDGGLAAWKKEGRAVSRETPDARQGRLTPRTRDVVVTADWVRANLAAANVRVLDARTSDFYTGTAEADMHSPRPGHIPGAANIPFTSLLAEGVTLKDRATLAELFTRAGAAPGSRVVTYCHIGQQGSLLYLVARHLGYDARLYDGSYEDWSRRKELPIVTGASPR